MSKIFLLVFSAIIIAMSCNQINSQNIDFSGVNGFRIGQNVDSLISRIKMNSLYDYEFIDSVCQIKDKDSNVVFTLTFSNRKIECVGVFSDKYVFNEIKVGSKILDIKKRYPDMMITYINDLEYECVELWDDRKENKIQIILSKEENLIGHYKSLLNPTSEFTLNGKVEGFLIFKEL